MKVELLLCCFSISGLFLIYFFQPKNKYVEKSVEDIVKECDGYAKVSGELVRSFVSKKGSKIGILEQNNSSIMVVLDEFYFESKNITVFAAVSRYGDECWLFAEKVEFDD